MTTDALLDVYVSGSPNGQRAIIVLEEMELHYNLHFLDLVAGDQHRADYLAINPHGRIPCLVDRSAQTPVTVTQSWMICLYLAEKTGRFLPNDPLGRIRATEWLFHVATDVMSLHSTHGALARHAPDCPPATIQWAEDRVRDALTYLDTRLARNDFLAGDLSVADLALYPIYNRRRELAARHGMNNLARWGNAMDRRPGCQRALAIIRENLP